MPRPRFVDRAGKLITEQSWKKKQADPSYTTVREYDNGVVRVTLKWNGRVPGNEAGFRQYWPVFILLVQNYSSAGTLVNDPADGDKKFGSEEEGIKAYEAFLTKWTECQVDEETGAFTEEGNILVPPPPPDPNKPTTAADDDVLGGVGAW